MTSPAEQRWLARLGRLEREFAQAPAMTAMAATACLGAARAAARGPRWRGVAAGAAFFAMHRHVTLSAIRSSRYARSAGDVAVFSALVPEVPLLFGDFAIDADFARALVWELAQGPKTVVEFGSGISTVIAAKLLEPQDGGEGGRIYSVEASESYAEGTARMLERAGVADRVELIVAPLRRQTFAGRDVAWHELEPLAPLRDLDIDVLVVDGPTSIRRLNPWARLPAMQLLHDQLVEDAVVLMDDGRRPMERRVAFAWARDYHDLELYWVDTVKGMWRLVRRHGARAAGTSARVMAVMGAVNPMPTTSGLMPVRRR